MSSRKASRHTSPTKEHHDYQATIIANSHGSLWTSRLLSLGGNKYGLVIIDDYSHFTWVFFLYDKCQVQEKVKTFVRKAQKEFGLPIKKMRSDNGTEFKNTLVEEFLDEEGIKHEFSTPYTPQQNGVVERKNCTLIDMARTMLDEYKTSDLFWSDAVNIAFHAINRLYLHKKLKKLHMSF